MCLVHTYIYIGDVIILPTNVHHHCKVLLVAKQLCITRTRDSSYKVYNNVIYIVGVYDYISKLYIFKFKSSIAMRLALL